MSLEDHIWYAVNSTKILLEPDKVLESFGQTKLNYIIISQLSDDPSKTRIRQGTIFSEKPLLLNLQDSQKIIENFGIEAKQYAKYLAKKNLLINIIQYGLQINKNNYSEEILSSNVEDVINKVLDDTTENKAVILGDDTMWEISLLKFMQSYIARSAPHNLSDLQSQTSLSYNEQIRLIKKGIEEDFFYARKNITALNKLGEKLTKYNLFAEYEDRFYALLKECKE